MLIRADDRTQDCSEKLNTIYRTYYPAPSGTPCVNILNATLTESDPALCPSNSSAIACFNVRSSARTYARHPVLCLSRACASAPRTVPAPASMWMWTLLS